MTKSILVCFEEGLPKRFREKFDEVLNVEALESLVSPGSVEDASQLVRELSFDRFQWPSNFEERKL